MNEQFKDTEIGRLPKEWEIKRLGDCLCVLRNGLTNKQNKQMHGLPITRIETISTGKINPKKVGFIEKLSEEEIDRYKLINGDILFSNINSEAYLGNSAIYIGEPKILMHGMNLLLFRTNKNLFYLFLNYLLNFYKNKKVFIAISSRAVNQASINQGKIKNLIIPLPPLEEQKRIAYVLSKIQHAIGIQDKLIKLLQELKKTMMHKLFTEGIEHTEFKDTEIGRMPKEWGIKKIKDVSLKIKAGGTPSRKEAKYWNGKIPFVLINDITNSGIYLCKTKESITEAGLENSSAWIVPINSLLVSMYATIGETVINKIQVATNQAILAIVPKPCFILEFGLYTIKYYNKVLINQNIQSTQKNVNKAIVENFIIPLPPLEEQKKIADILSTIDNKISIENKRKESFEKLFKTMLNKLMTGQIRTKNMEMIQ